MFVHLKYDLTINKLQIVRGHATGGRGTVDKAFMGKSQQYSAKWSTITWQLTLDPLEV